MNTRQALVVLQALIILLAALALQSCGKKDKPKPGPDPQPGTNGNTTLEITSFAPTTGMPGGEVIIQGKNFKDNILENTVYFNGVPASYAVLEATTTRLKVKIPQDATTGKLIVKTGNQSATSATDFIVDPKMIAVAAFSPASGPIGTPVTITGTNLFDAKIKFNGIECQLTNKTSTSLTFAIPLNTTLTSHKIEVISGTYTVQTQESFTVTHTGPYAHWEDKTIRLIYQDYPLFTGGLSFVYKNKIYWGFTEMFTGNDTAWYAVYDPAKHNDGWATIQEAPMAMAPLKLYRPAAVVHNDRVFFGTGMIQSTFYNKWWEFHPETNTATQLTDYPESTAGAITFTLNNKVYAGFGGTKKNLHEFNPAGNNNKGGWSLATVAAFDEIASGNAVVLGNEVYLGRALTGQLQTRNAFFQFKEGTGITRVNDMPQDLPSSTTPSFSLGNKGYFVINKNVWEYTPDATGGTWRVVIGGDQAPAIKHVAKVTVNGMLVVYGWTSTGHIHEFKL